MEEKELNLVRQIIHGNVDKRCEILQAYFNKIELDFYKDSLPQIIELIKAAYRQGINEAY